MFQRRAAGRTTTSRRRGGVQGERMGGRGKGVGWGNRCDGGSIRCGGVGSAGGGRCGHDRRLSALRLVHVKVSMMVLGAAGAGVARRVF